MRHYFILIAFLLAPLPAALAAPEAADSGLSAAQTTVQTIADYARNLDDKALKEKAKRRIEELVDFSELSVNALGEHASSMTAQQRAKVQNLLKTILTGTIYPQAGKFFSDVNIAYSGESQAKADGRELVKVTSTVSKNNKRSKVEYWLKQTPTGMRVVDLAIEGERWVENVQMQFDELIRQKGVNGLVARIRTSPKSI